MDWIPDYVWVLVVLGVVIAYLVYSQLTLRPFEKNEEWQAQEGNRYYGGNNSAIIIVGLLLGFGLVVVFTVYWDEISKFLLP